MDQFGHTSGKTVVTPTDRPETRVHTRCVIEVFCGVLLCRHVAFMVFL